MDGQGQLHFIGAIIVYKNVAYHTLIVCGDFNVNFNDDTPHRRSLISLLANFGLYGTVDFPTRTHNNSITKVENIFVNSIKQNSINVYPWINGLSDHDAQFLVLHDIKIRIYKKIFYTYRSFNKLAIKNFNLQLSYESCEGRSFHVKRSIRVLIDFLICT